MLVTFFLSFYYFFPLPLLPFRFGFSSSSSYIERDGYYPSFIPWKENKKVSVLQQWWYSSKNTIYRAKRTSRVVGIHYRVERWRGGDQQRGSYLHRYRFCHSIPSGFPGRFIQTHLISSLLLLLFLLLLPILILMVLPFIFRRLFFLCAAVPYPRCFDQYEEQTYRHTRTNKSNARLNPR